MFPAPLRRLGESLSRCLPEAAVGIDLGRATLRVVALRRGRRGVEVAGLASAPRGGAAEEALDPALLRATVRRACRSLAWWPRRVVVGVGAGTVLMRALQVHAPADEAETAEAVERAAQSLPVALADLRLAWVPLGGSQAAPDGQSRSVLMVAARREPVLARQRVATRAGLGRVLVDVDALAALRAVVRGLPQASCQGVLVDAGSDSLRAIAWAPGEVPVLRVLPLPQRCPATDLAAVVAEAVHGIGPVGVGQASGVILAGGRMLEDGVAAAIEATLGAPCRVVDAFAGLCDESGAAGLPTSSAAWLVAVGLAQRGLA